MTGGKAEEISVGHFEGSSGMWECVTVVMAMMMVMM